MTIPNITFEPSSIIRVLDAANGRFQEETLKPASMTLTEAMIPYPRDSRGRITINPDNLPLTEAVGGRLSTYNFPDLLRQGVQFDAFTSYNEIPTTYQNFARVYSSNKLQEEYLKDVGLGIMPVVAEGEDYPEAAVSLGDGLIIKNAKRGYILSVTEEMMKFDQVGKVRQLAELIGRAAKLTEEMAVMDILTTTTNYTRSAVSGDNDEGANTQNLTFSAQALITAMAVLTTMKDRKSGAKLGILPNTLIVTPKLRFAVMQLLRSPENLRANGGTEVYGTGTTNPFFGLVPNIIVSPYFGNGYEWALIESNRAVAFQRVEPFQVLRESMDATSDSYFERDVIRFRGRTWFGAGMVDDRFAFFSNSTTAPTVN